MSQLAALPLAAIPTLATVDASLNAVATVLLVTGFVLIKQRRIEAHKRTMLAAFVVSIAFLSCYLTYHFTPHEPVKFGGSGPIRGLYFSILISHIVLAATVPFLAIWTIYLGLKDYRSRHLRWAWWTLLVANTIALVSAMKYDWTVNAIGPFEMTEYLGLLLVWIALGVTAPFLVPLGEQSTRQRPVRA